MHCGIILSGNRDDHSAVAFLDEDGSATHSVATNEDILALLEEKRPQVIALNAPPERRTEQRFPSDPEADGSLDEETAKQFRSGEETLIEQGHAILPQGMREKAVLERADHLARRIEVSGMGTTTIESSPHIVSDILGLKGDDDLKSFGVATADIETAREYDAVLLAIVARLYAENRCDDHGIVVPEDDVTSI